ncbi:MAG: protein kinase, partial [Bdellovibrionales bacterium]|nr:protein kinase [Bdellovibrionales bacterium]
MERVSGQAPIYEIQNLIGEGLTSCVYKAVRKDPRGWTAQKVALKVLKSKKDVHILKNEFEKLQRVRSKYCVKLLAWETLPQGPALVLELLQGLSLQE